MKRNLLRLFILSVMSIFTLGASATPDKDYLCFTANTAGSTVELTKEESPTVVTIEYSTDGTEWFTYTFETAIPLTNVGDKVYFRNAKTAEDVTEFSKNRNYYYFVMSGSIAASGNVMSLIDKDCTTTTIPCEYCFTRLFKDCTGLTSAPKLPATTLATYCYYYMFKGCTGLTSAPELPATTSAKYCYYYMFNGCTALASAPELPATTLADHCYSNMFTGCTSLASAPELPVTTLATYCYYYMFNGCTSLASAPELPATTLADHCYSYMFKGCTSLASAPKLPATTSATYCYSDMFENCTSLASAPELPATTLADYCYTCMFYGCTSLASAPELPATTLAKACYQNMFSRCTSLASAPELPATTLAKDCYQNIFNGCGNLNDIKVGFTEWSYNYSYTNGWVASVPESGTFACPTGLPKEFSGDRIPHYGKEWTVTNNFDLTITDAGWASMCVNLPLQVPKGVEVYYASAVNGSTISLTQIEAGTTIAARTAVLVKGAKGTVSFPIMGEAGKSYSGNLFKGTSVDKPRTEDVYVLSGVGTTGNPQFKNYTVTTLGAHKIWLPKSAVGGSTGAINFVFDDATAINGMDAATPKSSVRYNLNGQAVGADYKGIVIVNGKKYINK